RNTANAGSAAVVGGSQNRAIGQFAFVGGGYTNTASGNFATAPGGRQNSAQGDYSFAAGSQALATNQGAFVWADSQPAPFGSTTTNQFNVRASGGARFVTSGAGMTLDGQPVLAGTISLAQLPSAVVTNNQSGLALNGTFSGIGTGLTGV